MSRGRYLVELATKNKKGENEGLIRKVIQDAEVQPKETETKVASPLEEKNIGRDVDQLKTSDLPELALHSPVEKDGVPSWDEEHTTSASACLIDGSVSDCILLDINVISNNDDAKVLDCLHHGKIIYQEPLPIGEIEPTFTEYESINENTSLLTDAVQDGTFNISGFTDVINNSDSICNIIEDIQFNHSNQTPTTPYYDNSDDPVDPDDPEWRPVENNGNNSDNGESDLEKSEGNVENVNHEETINEGLEVTANNINNSRKSRGRKRKFPEQNKEIAKKRKNSNLSYHNSKGILQERKQFINVQCSCKQKCYNSVSEDIRRLEYEKFWELADYNAQNLYITSCVEEGEKKRSYGRDTSKRKFSRVYKLRNVSVCRQMFISTLRISSKRVNTALVKMRSNMLKDRRGLEQAGKNQLTDDKINDVKNHINKIPKYKSHYRRETTNNCDFLPPEITLQKMYDKYVEEKMDNYCSLQQKSNISSMNQEERKEVIKKIDAVSFSSYRKIFLKYFNLKFKTLKKDTCNTCDTFAAKIRSATGDEKIELQDQHKKHLDFANGARQQLKEDGKEATQNNKRESLTFDLEKTLPLPRIPTNLIFYKRQLWFYNAGVHSLTTGRGYCYVWTEGEAGRGAQEIGSCLLKHIKNYVGGEVEDLVLWSDSCGGQNRNVKMVLLLKACLETHSSLKTITLKFLMPGHSFLPNDADFSDIESALKHVQRLYLPEDYINVIKNCRRKKPFCVTKMKSTDFVGTEILEKQIVNRKKTDEEIPKKISWLKIREIHLKKGEPMKIYCRKDFTSEYDVINIDRNRTKGRRKYNLSATQLSFNESLKPLWPTGKDIAAPKLKDLKSILHLIPNDAKPFYQSLNGDRSVIDDVDGYCAPLDFDIEED